MKRSNKNRLTGNETAEERNRRIAKMAQAMTSEQVQFAQENQRRHTQFENPKRKGTRGSIARKALRESQDF